MLSPLCNNYFMQLGFSSNATSDTVALTNFVKNFNFCGRLYFNSLAAKPLSDLYYDSSSNFQWMTKSPVEYWFINSRTRLFIQSKTALIKMRNVWKDYWKWSLFLIKKRFLIKVIKKRFCKMKWKWAGSGSAGDVWKSSTV